MRPMIVCKPPPKKHGTCELCGGHNLDLRILIMPEFIGWACGQCVEQVGKCMPRRYIPSAEESEPVE